MMKKQWVAVLLLLCLLLSLCPFSAYAEDLDIDLIDVGEAEEDISAEELGDDLIAVVDGDDAWLTEEPAEFFASGRQYSRLLLHIDWSLIEQVEHQEGGSACACFSLAYCRTLLDGVPHQYSEYNIGTVQSAWCSWSLGSYNMLFLEDKFDAYEKIYRELCGGNPVVACVAGSRASQHYVAIVGFENVVSGQPLSAGNFLIIDSVAPYYAAENMGTVGYDLKLLEDGTYQLDCDQTAATVSFEAHTSSYLSRCSFYTSYRSLKTTRSVYLRNLPCTPSGDSTSTVLVTLPAGASFTADALVKNPYGEYWYKGKTAEGREGYAYAGYFGAGTSLFKDITVNDPELPYKLDSGCSFSIRGKLRAPINVFSAVSASVYAGADTASTRVTGGDVYPEMQYYSLEKSALADTLQFQKLKSGYYTFILTVKCRNYYSADGKTLKCTEKELPLITQGFTVGKVDTYTVSYNANGGSGAPASQTKINGVNLTLSTKKPTRSGYTFLGWATSKSASTAQYQPGGLYQANASAVLYAVWKNNEQKPSLTAQPRGVNAVLGSTAKFSVSASGSNLSYQWYYKVPTGGSWYKCTGTGAKTSTYAVEARDYRNGYYYRCAVTNAGGTVYSYSAMLSVLTVPKVTVQPKNAVKAVGETAKFSVTATGGALSYQWYYRMSSKDSWKACSRTGYNTSTLTVEAWSYRKGYQYRCLVKNAAGEVYSSTVTLTVKS